MRSTYVHGMGLGFVLCLCLISLGCGTGAYKSASREENSQATPAKTRAPMMDAAPLAEIALPSATTEAYAHVAESPLVAVKDRPRSTFSIDVDTASYSNVRRFLQQRQLPPPDAVRIEECINYFTYDYPPPDGDAPFSVHAEVAGCPWNPAHRLAKIGIQGRRIAAQQRPGSNLVFLLDVSGSMNHPKKLPLLKESMRMLLEQLGENDHVALVVYAGAAGVVLPSTSATRKQVIHHAIENLHANGSTNGALGIRLAYDIAVENFIKDGVNRVLLCTDGDFNVGITDPAQLTELIESRAKSGVFLSVLGFGMGNLKDATMERLADRGNGNYAYIDSHAEAKKVLVDQLSGTLVTIAKDVKIQVEFNPAQVAGYRLIGYDNRRLADRDFKDDTKDAGEIGAGHSVTALYEIVPAGIALASQRRPDEEPLKYQPATATTDDSVVEPQPVVAAPPFSDELLTVSLRYKPLTGDTSLPLKFAVTDGGTSFAQATSDFRFASAVALFAMLLKDSPYCGQSTLDLVLELADTARGTDPNGYRAEFVDLVRQARALRSDQPSRREMPAD